MTRRWTAETDREAGRFYATLAVGEIRRRQELADAQIRRAYDARNDDALADLQAMSDALMRSLLERTLP